MISYFILLFQLLSLCFWIGGSAVLLWIVAPTLFNILQGSSDASKMVESLMKKFNFLFVFDAILLGMTLYVQMAFLDHGIFIKLRIATTLVSVAMLLAAYQRFGLTPRIERMRTSVAGIPEDQEKIVRPGLESLHRRVLALFSVNFLLGVAVVITLLLPLF